MCAACDNHLGTLACKLFSILCNRKNSDASFKRFCVIIQVKSKIVCKLLAAPSYAASISSLCRLAMAASPAALFSSSITAGL